MPEIITPSHPPEGVSPRSIGGSSHEISATVIARGVKLEGDFQSEGDVRIEGQIQGTLTVGGALTVGKEAFIKARVHASSAMVSGTIEGDMEIGQSLQVMASATITGNITAKTLAMEAGATVTGQARIGSGGSTKA